MILHTSVCSGNTIPEGKIIPGHLKALGVKKNKNETDTPGESRVRISVRTPDFETVTQKK